MNNEQGELVFLRYAFPVLGYCNDIRVNPEEIRHYEDILKHGGDVSTDRLTELFPDAVKHLKSWNRDDVKDYWLRKHNEIVYENPHCGVYPARVKEIIEPNGNETCRAILNSKGALGEMNFGSYIPLQQGDLVSMHAFAVAEKLSPQDISRYFSRRIRTL